MNSENTLDRIKSHQSVRILQIRGGRNSRQRLNQFGIHVGEIIFVKRSCTMGGPVLVQVHGSEVAVGHRMAGHVIVEPVQSQNIT